MPPTKFFTREYGCAGTQALMTGEGAGMRPGRGLKFRMGIGDNRSLSYEPTRGMKRIL